MSGFFLDLFWLISMPDAQPGDWYGWVTVFAAHALLVGGGLAVALMICRIPQWIGAVGYATWEAAQLFFGGQWIDGAVDLAAVVLGQALVWAAWRGRRRVLSGAAAGIAIMSAIGIWRRR
jgi:hypothetical protein